MEILRAVVLCSFGALCSSLSGVAEQRLSQDAGAVAAFQAFEGAGNEEYVLGCGDQISIMVVGHAEATGKQTVGPDGVITLPYAGSVRVSEMTRHDAATTIERALAPYYLNPSVVVGVDVYSSNNVIVLGAVAKPGLMPLDSPTTLLSILSRAGTASQTSPVIQGKPIAVPERVALFRGRQKVLSIDFRRALEEADPRLQLRLKKDDVVYVPSPNEEFVLVFGEVLHPGLVELQSGSTLAQLIAEAGGVVTDRSGRYPKIQIVHEATGQIEIVNYEDILLSKVRGLKLTSGDLVYIPESKFSRLSVSLQKISPLFSIATVATLVDRP